MVTFLSPKIPKKYTCENCNYLTSNKKDFQKHLKTIKHNGDTNGDNGDIKKNVHFSIYSCECGKEYKYRQGLSRHKKKCSYTNCVNINCIDNDDTQIVIKNNGQLDIQATILQLLKQNTDFMKEIKEIVKEPKIVNNTTNNNTNNQFNVMNYLNNECKDAMNFTEFIDTFEFTIDDLELLANKGYQETMEKTFIRQLQNMDKTKRPIHCSDKKRKSFYVKEDGVWEKDSDNTKLVRGVKRIASRHFTTIHKWRASNPDCFDNDRKHIFFNKAMGQVSKCDNDRQMKKVINHLSGLSLKYTK